MKVKEFLDAVQQYCFWLSWPKDDPAWFWLGAVIWAEKEPGSLFELLLMAEEGPPKSVRPFILDFLSRITLGKNTRGPKTPLWVCGTVLEAQRRIVAHLVEERGIPVEAAVDQVARMKVEPNPFWPNLTRDWSARDRNYLHAYCTGNVGHGARKRKQRAEVQFTFGDRKLLITMVLQTKPR